MNEHRHIDGQSNFTVDGKNSSEPMSPPEPQIVQINADYRFRRHVLKCVGKGMTIWELQKLRKKDGALVWEFMANDRRPIRLGLYCQRLGIHPDPANAKMLSSLAFK